MTGRLILAFAVLGLPLLCAAGAAFLARQPGLMPATKRALWLACAGLLAVPAAMAWEALRTLFGGRGGSVPDIVALGPLLAGLAFAACRRDVPPGWPRRFCLACAIVLIPVGLLLGLGSLLFGGVHTHH